MKYPEFEIIKSQKEDVLQIKEDNLIGILLDKIKGYCGKEGDQLLGLNELDSLLLKKCFWLNTNYDWVIVQNKYDRDLRLVPLKKEK